METEIEGSTQYGYRSLQLTQPLRSAQPHGLVGTRQTCHWNYDCFYTTPLLPLSLFSSTSLSILLSPIALIVAQILILMLLSPSNSWSPSPLSLSLLDLLELTSGAVVKWPAQLSWRVFFFPAVRLYTFSCLPETHHSTSQHITLGQCGRVLVSGVESVLGETLRTLLSQQPSVVDMTFTQTSLKSSIP